MELKPNNPLDQNLYKGILPLYVILPIFPVGIEIVSDEQSKKKLYIIMLNINLNNLKQLTKIGGNLQICNCLDANWWSWHVEQ